MYPTSEMMEIWRCKFEGKDLAALPPGFGVQILRTFTVKCVNVSLPVLTPYDRIIITAPDEQDINIGGLGVLPRGTSLIIKGKRQKEDSHAPD